MNQPAPNPDSGESIDPALAQRLDALEKANRVRVDRKKLKRDLAGGRRSLESVLASPPPACLHTAKISDLLIELPRYGRVRVDKVLTSCRIPASTRIEALSDQQRRAILASVTRHAPASLRTVGAR